MHGIAASKPVRFGASGERFPGGCGSDVEQLGDEAGAVLRKWFMLSAMRRFLEVIVCLVPFLWASCVSMTLPKGGQVEPSLKGPATYNVDKDLVNTWELLYQINDKGEKDLVAADKPRTLIEFTDKGRVIFNKIYRDSPNALTSHQGSYSVDKGFINITDHKGRTSQWPYEVNGETLMTSMPDLKLKFFWRRSR